MALYAWTIQVPNRQPIKRVTNIDELHGVLRMLDLPGLRYPQDITVNDNGGVADSGKFRHVDVEDGFDWSVTWVKVDGGAD
ncbi:hypothetical protein ASG68_25060 [Rhizobium sp. Leaf453]|nr:hypothetical protein ASG50_28885 [Rhizobium sp. Leaf386]KQU06013.1 hypothetical protein ASG68_25060 [Rhizobium sp. Leaf453]